MATHETMGTKINFEVITSFNQTYYDRIGRNAVQSYLEHWSTPLTVYAEDCDISTDSRLHVKDFSCLGDQYLEFQADDTLSARCRTFAKKAFCVIHAMYNSKADWIVWLDADVLTKQRDPAAVLQAVLEPHYLAMFMGVRYTEHRDVKRGNWLVPETGLFGVNLRHPGSDQFRREYLRRYLERDFSDLRRTYDNDVFGATVTHISADYLDLCSKLNKPYKTPLKHTMFGDYLHHYKAKHSKETYVANQ